jgi:hypothetical protein
MSQTQPVKKIIVVNKGGIPIKKIPVVNIVDAQEPVKTTVSNKYKIVIVNGVRKLVKIEDSEQTSVSAPVVSLVEPQLAKPVKKTIIIVKKNLPVVNKVLEVLPALEPVTPTNNALPFASLPIITEKEVVEPLVEAPKASKKDDKELTVDQLLFRSIKGNRPDDVVKYIGMGGNIYYQNSDALENIAERGLVKVFQAIYSVMAIDKEIVADCIEAAEECNRVKVVEFLKTKL